MRHAWSQGRRPRSRLCLTARRQPLPRTVRPTACGAGRQRNVTHSSGWMISVDILRESGRICRHRPATASGTEPDIVVTRDVTPPRDRPPGQSKAVTSMPNSRTVGLTAIVRTSLRVRLPGNAGIEPPGGSIVGRLPSEHLAAVPARLEGLHFRDIDLPCIRVSRCARLNLCNIDSVA